MTCESRLLEWAAATYVDRGCGCGRRRKAVPFQPWRHTHPRRRAYIDCDAPQSGPSRTPCPPSPSTPRHLPRLPKPQPISAHHAPYPLLSSPRLRLVSVFSLLFFSLFLSSYCLFLALAALAAVTSFYSWNPSSRILWNCPLLQISQNVPECSGTPHWWLLG